MKTILALSLVALAAGCADYGPPRPMNAKAQSSFEDKLAGRVAGDPIACVRQRDLGSSTPFDEQTILFDGPGSTVYVNHLRNACPGMKPWHALKTRTTGTSLCEGDLMRVFDPNTGVEYGGCSLGQFTPYRRAG